MVFSCTSIFITIVGCFKVEGKVISFQLPLLYNSFGNVTLGPLKYNKVTIKCTMSKVYISLKKNKTSFFLKNKVNIITRLFNYPYFHSD